MKSEFITLTDYHIEKANTLAKLRKDECIRNNRVSRDNMVDDSPYENLLGARTETAAYLYFRTIGIGKVSWNHNNGNYVGECCADIDTFIDVKGVDSSRKSLLIKPRYEDNWAFLLVNAEAHPTYEIVGWCWGKEGKINHKSIYKTYDKNRPKAYFIPRNHEIIKPPQLLFNILKEKIECPV